MEPLRSGSSIPAHVGELRCPGVCAPGNFRPISSVSRGDVIPPAVVMSAQNRSTTQTPSDPLSFLGPRANLALSIDDDPSALHNGGNWRNFDGRPQHQEPSGQALPEVEDPSQGGASLCRVGGDSHPHPGDRGTDADIHHGTPGFGQGLLAEGGRNGARRNRAEVMGLTDGLGSGPLAVDTAAFIYFIEEHPESRTVTASLVICFSSSS